MKKLIPLFAVFLIVFISCQEQKPPGVTLLDPVKAEDSSYVASVETPQQKKVLIEEATGVNCTNCPTGARLLKSIIQQNNNNAILVAIHYNGSPFTKPFADSKHDFRTEEGTAIVNSLGQTGIPAAVIDRVRDNQNRYFRTSSEWSTLVAERINNVSSPINLHMQSTYNVDNNNVELLVRSAFIKDYTDELSLTIYVVENEIYDYQLDNGVTIPDYKHDHVFRDAITSIEGTSLNFGDHTAGTVLQKRFNFNPTIDGDEPWNLDNCNIIAYVWDTKTREVLHVDEVKLKP